MENDKQELAIPTYPRELRSLLVMKTLSQAMIPVFSGPPPDLSRLEQQRFYTDNSTAHLRNTTALRYHRYMIGTGGYCSLFDPPVSYWCSEHPAGGSAADFRIPGGIAASTSLLPNAPYSNPSQMVIIAWHPKRWATWMFEVKNYENSVRVDDDNNNKKTSVYNFTFGRGGYQGARGADTGGDFLIENVFEELDYPGEFFFNESTGDLFLFHNGTGVPPKTIVVPKLETIVNISGTQWDPVVGVTYSGITFKAARYTYMNPHGVPSAGDWALDRYGAIFLQGTEGVLFDNCAFERVDGNGVMISGYNRNATIKDSDFSFIGGNAIAAWGYTNETRSDPGRPGVIIENAPQAGIDGTDGNHPRYTTVTGCTAREIGLYEKQSSFFVQAKTAGTKISGNVFFNGPRAGINFNDGFGGGDKMSNNLVFSTCRESGDHGPFNSWDRQPFITDMTGEPSLQMAWREIHHNFFIDNYSPQEDIDNDDGSSYYHSHHNFLVYGEMGEKSDFGGHNNYHDNNIYAYIQRGLSVCPQLHGTANHFENNTVLITDGKVGRGHYFCNSTDEYERPVIRRNKYFTETGDIEECGMDLKAWQAKSPLNDPGSTVSKYPKDDRIIKWARDLLNF